MDRTIELRAAALGPLRDTIEQNPHATIEPSRQGDDARALDALGVLEALRGDPARGRRSLEIEHTLGQGGMGVVRLATQVSVGRKVAVKTLREDQRSETATLRLLREAWVTGTLEHPNVVPVYDVGLDERGAPVIVLKRIEGVQWGELMGDGPRVTERFRTRDLLEWNLGILMQVCNAVHFAHSRGIVHRDLKPENVMIGEFGEVYLLDWGIAVSLRDDGTGRLPLARDAKQLAGTPCYMAPEALGIDSAPITERTDVYLLGSVLYELLTGQPPHDGDTVLQILASIASGEPDFPDTAAPELVRICRRAMVRDPDGRFESAEQFRLAIQGFLQHRDSAILADEADVSFAALRAELANEGPVLPERRQRAYNLFGACRFGYREALRIWPSNESARANFREAAITMVDFELGARDARSARVLLGELDAPPDDLVARVEATARALDEEAKQARKLETLGREFDESVGRRTRAFLAVLAGLVWSISPFALSLLGEDAGSRRNQALYPLGMMVGFAAFAWWARDSMTKTRINRALMAVVFLTLLAQSMLQLGCALLGVSALASGVLNLFLWGTVVGGLAAAIEPRFVVASVAFYACFFAACVRPSWRWYLMSAANVVLTGTMIWAWGWSAWQTTPWWVRVSADHKHIWRGEPRE